MTHDATLGLMVGNILAAIIVLIIPTGLVSVVYGDVKHNHDDPMGLVVAVIVWTIIAIGAGMWVFDG